MYNTTFPVQISEKQFMRQYDTAKRYVDMGIKDYFILFENDAFANVSEIGNTTLKDISDVFGIGYPVFFRFAGFLIEELVSMIERIIKHLRYVQFLKVTLENYEAQSDFSQKTAGYVIGETQQDSAFYFRLFKS